MSYFSEIESYETYATAADDLHFNFNANSGGGQSFLGGKFLNAERELVSSSTLNARTAIFCVRFVSEDGSNRIVSLSNAAVRYEIKPRAASSTSMKLSVGDKRPPSAVVSSFLMLPRSCGVNRSENLDVSVLSLKNYWIQSMWLDANLTQDGIAFLGIKDCVLCGGVTGNGNGKARYFKVHVSERIRDVIRVARQVNWDDNIANCLSLFAAIYTGQREFDYVEATTAIEEVMKHLREKYPDRYSGLTDPLTIIMDLVKEHRPMPRNYVELDVPRQLITYGAPGTGKSHGTEGKVKELGIQDVFRTTFHPDSDYSTFVGAYKPTMKNVPRIVQIGQDIKKPGFAPDVEDELKVEEKISYKFRPQAFLNAYVAAWMDLTKPVVLIIEEINRGNCAQIFGDLFQLLDRDDATGYSTYPITADTDLAKWLAEVPRFGKKGLADPGKPECIMPDDWAKVLKGEMLAIPRNLYIWATMNTSDQSLFPIDSAFKRRWDWKYVPIREGKDKDGNKLDWTIKFLIPGKPAEGEQPAVPEKKFTYDWWKFLLCINKLIYKTTESEDKKLGYFFVKPDGKSAPNKEEKDVISADRFVDKVVFYLWNDVFKDYGIESVFKNEQVEKKNNDEDGQAVAFERFFAEDGDKADPKVLAAFFKALEFEPDNVEEVDVPAAPQQVPQEVPTEAPAAPAEAPAAPVDEPVIPPAE